MSPSNIKWGSLLIEMYVDEEIRLLLSICIALIKPLHANLYTSYTEVYTLYTACSGYLKITSQG